MLPYCSIFHNFHQTGKFQTKLHSQKVTNLAPENRPTPTFSGAVAVKLQGVVATWGPRLYYWYHWYLHLTMLRKNTWAPAKSESFNWVLLLMFFLGVEFGCWCCWNLFVGFVFGGIWFLVLLMLFLVGAYIFYLVQYPINGSIDVIGTFQNEWFWNVSSGPSSNNTFWGEVGWGNTFHWLATLCRKPSRWILFNLPPANNPPKK